MERAVVLALGVICVVVFPVLALVFYVVRKSKPRRFRLSASLLKLISINIEVDGQDEPNKLSPGEADQDGTVQSDAGYSPSRGIKP